MTTEQVQLFFVFFVASIALWWVADMIIFFVENAINKARWRRFEESPLSIFCPRCGAQRGEPCKGMRTESHAGREKLAKDVNQLNGKQQ